MRAYLLPAILGDEPQLADLRRRLEGVIAFDLVDLPGADEPATLLASMSQTAQWIADRIAGREPAGSVALVGFSFGASLALEVAVRLERVGRRVSFLAILDGAFRTIELRRSKAELLRVALTPTGAWSLARHLFDRVNNRRKLILAGRCPQADASPALQEMLLQDLRCRALNTWRPVGCTAPGVVVFSGGLGEANRRQWLELCPGLTAVDVEAKHGDFLRGRSLDAIVEALVEATGRAPMTG